MFRKVAHDIADQLQLNHRYNKAQMAGLTGYKICSLTAKQILHYKKQLSPWLHPMQWIKQK